MQSFGPDSLQTEPMRPTGLRLIGYQDTQLFIHEGCRYRRTLLVVIPLNWLSQRQDPPDIVSQPVDFITAL